MSTLLVTAVLALGVGEQPEGKQAAGPMLDGKWLIVYAEEGGRRNNAWEQRQATLKGDTLTYDDDGKERALKLKFGARQTVEATGGREAKAQQGVYIAAQDYLCISLGEAAKGGADRGRQSSGSFILILRRQQAAR